MGDYVNEEKKQEQKYQTTSMLRGQAQTFQFGDRQEEFEELNYNKVGNIENAVYANHQHMVDASKDLAVDKKTFGDSKSMGKVKNSMECLYSQLVNKIPENKELFMEVAIKIAAEYEKYINACDTYIKSHNPKTNHGKARLDMVKELFLTAKKEKEYFEAALNAYGDSQYNDGVQRKEIKFLDLLRYARADVVDVKQFESSGSTGSIRKYTSDNKTYFFKKTEYAKEGSLADLYTNAYGDILAGKQGTEYQKYLMTLDTIRSKLTKSVTGNIDEDIASVVLQQMFYVVFSQENSSRYHLAMKSLKERARGKRAGAYISELELFLSENKETHEKIATEIGSPLFTTQVSKYNQIKEGANITMRAVATSRLDKHLGIDGIVDTKSVFIKDEKGITETGLRMEAAKGISLADLDDKVEEDKKTKGSTVARFTPSAAKKLQEIMLLDYLLGQGDRHADNIIVDYKKVGNEYIVSDLKGIDNDMCLGDLSGEKVNFGFNRIVPMLKQSCAGKIKSKNDCVIKYIHEDTYNKFMTLQPETLFNLFVDCDLSPKEWKALKSRFDTLQKVLTALHAGDRVIRDNKYSKASMGALFDMNHVGEFSILSLMHESLLRKSFKEI